MLLIVTLLIVRPKFVVVLILFADYTKWWISARFLQIVLLWVCRTSFNISPYCASTLVRTPKLCRRATNCTEKW